MIPVSVIITTRNEESRIGDCIRALKGFSEIIVVDSSSTDLTVSTAQDLGATCVNFVWNGQYPKKRQWCLDNVKTKNDWIFFVDADEVITSELKREISNLDFLCAGYFVRGRYIWLGKPLNRGLKNNKLALLNRHKFEYPVINDLDLPMGEMEGHYQPVLKPAFAHEKIGQLKSALDHHAAVSPVEWAGRHERYAVWERGMNDRDAWPADPVWYRQVLKTVFRHMPLRDVVAFLHSYILKCGFMDGRAGLDFARARAAYYRMIRVVDEPRARSLYIQSHSDRM